MRRIRDLLRNPLIVLMLSAVRTALRPALAVLLLVGCGVACCETGDESCPQPGNSAISADLPGAEACDAVAPSAPFEIPRVAVAAPLDAPWRPAPSLATADILDAAPKTSPPVV